MEKRLREQMFISGGDMQNHKKEKDVEKLKKLQKRNMISLDRK